MDRIFDELEIEDSNLVTTGLSVRVETEYDRDSRRSVHRGYRATTSTSVTLSDASLVAKILREGTQRVGAEISGPHWHLSLDNPARVNAYESAARDAQRKAQAYVSALGARLGSILTISEPGTHRIERTYEDAMMAPSSSGDDFPEIEVHQGGLQVGAQVEVTFLVEQS
jgi:uncharacterized protein YggE